MQRSYSNLQRICDIDSCKRKVTGKIGRRLWHLLGGSFFPVLAFFIPVETLLIAIGAVLAGFVLAEAIRFAFPTVNHRVVLHLSGALKDEERYRPTSSIYMLIATLLVFLLFDQYIAIAALLFLAVGDPVASVVGERVGRTKVLGKTLEGSLACLISCLAIGILLAELSIISLPVVIVGATVATVIELLSFHIDDNLTMPLGSAGAMALVATL